VQIILKFKYINNFHIVAKRFKIQSVIMQMNSLKIKGPRLLNDWLRSTFKYYLIDTSLSSYHISVCIEVSSITR
jgi:hypothetical protein